jgi:hypothetical protein
MSDRLLKTLVLTVLRLNVERKSSVVSSLAAITLFSFAFLCVGGGGGCWLSAR